MIKSLAVLQKFYKLCILVGGESEFLRNNFDMIVIGICGAYGLRATVQAWRITPSLRSIQSNGSLLVGAKGGEHTLDPI